ncbi:MAG: hypothetical protein ACE5GL_01125 [Calditrichia bacterium]
MRIIKLKLASLFLLLLFIEMLPASIFEKLSLEELVNKSDLIVEGTVVDINCKWNEEKTMIYTDVTLKVAKVEKGTTKKMRL